MSAPTNAANPVPAVDTAGAPAPTTSPRDRQELLRAGGFVEDAFSRAATTPAFSRHSPKAGALQRAARADLHVLRADPEPAEALLRNTHAADPLLRLCLALLAEDDSAQQTWGEQGWEVYADNRDAYDAAFGDLIPAYFQKVVREEHEAQARRRAYDADANGIAAADWDTYLECLQKRRASNPGGITTGLPTLDRALGGGLSGLTFLGGSPGLGKSALVTAVALAALRHHPDLAVLFYNLDMPKQAMYDRVFASASGIDHRRLAAADLTDAEKRALADASQRLREQCLGRLRVLHEAPRDVYTLNKAVNDLNALSGTARTLVILDYLQLVPPPASEQGDPAPQEADHYRVNLLRNAYDSSCTADCPDGYPILVVSEVRKTDSGRTQLSVADLLGSIRLGHSPDTVLLLEKDSEARAPDGVSPVLLRVGKARPGDAGRTIPLLFDYRRFRFEEPKVADKSVPKKRRNDRSNGGRQPSSGLDPIAGMEGR